LLTAGTCERRDDGGINNGDDGNIIEGSEVVGEIVPADTDISEDIFGITEEGDFSTEISGDIEPVDDNGFSSTSGTLLDGFRVQIFASSYEDNAQRMADEIRSSITDENVYVQNISNMWKVRVGDCVDRGEAEALRGRLTGQGFSDAWIVRETVTVK